MDMNQSKALIDKLDFLSERQKIILTSDQDLIESIVSVIDSENLNYSQNVVVFPGKRPSHYLRKTLAEKINTSFIPPRIFSIDEFINFIFKKLNDTNSIESIDATGIIYEICIKNNSLTTFFQKFDNFFSIGLKLFNLFEELYIEGISVDKLKEVETLVEIPVNSRNSLRFLSQTYKQFYELLINRNLYTRSLRYRTVAEADLNSYLSFQKIIFAGFFAFTKTEKIILEKLSKIENFFLVFQDDDEALNTKIKFYSCPDTHGEIKVAGKIIKEFDSLDERTVIVLPDAENLFPLVRQGISYLDERSYNISMGYPLSRTPIYGFFITLFELLSSIENDMVYVPFYLKFMLHPYTKNIFFKNSAELSRIVFHEMEEFFKFEKPLLFIELEWIEKEVPSKIIQNIGESFLSAEEISEHIKFIHENTIKKFLSFSNIKEFINACRELLIFIYDKSTAKYHPLFYPYVEAFLTEFEKLSNSLINKVKFEFKQSYFNFFKNYVASQNIPFEGIPLNGLQILGFLETRNIKFKKVIFLDLNEGVFPNLSEDYLLPYRIRKILGLPTYHDREKLIYYYFSTLIRGAEEVHIAYIKNDRYERSRFIEKLIWIIEKKEGAILEDNQSDLIHSVIYKVNLAGKMPDNIVKNHEMMDILKNFSFSATALDEYLKCGLKFYYSYVLGIKKEKDVSSDLDRCDIGIIVHEALKEYFKLRIGRVLNEKNLTNEIEKILDNIFLKQYGNKIRGRVYLLKLQTLDRLREIINYYQEISKIHKIEIISVEEFFEETLFDSIFTCRLDKVEKVNEKIFIVDYKITGKQDHLKIKFDRLSAEDRQSWAKYIGSFQIPLYVFLYSQKYKINPQNLEGYYFLLGRNVIDNDAFFDPLNEIEKGQGLSIISEIMKSLLAEIKNLEIPFQPTYDFKKNCKFCDYQAICGTFTVPS